MSSGNPNAYGVVAYAREILGTGSTDKVVIDRRALAVLTRLAKSTTQYTKAARIARARAKEAGE